MLGFWICSVAGHLQVQKWTLWCQKWQAARFHLPESLGCLSSNTFSSSPSSMMLEISLYTESIKSFLSQMLLRLSAYLGSGGSISHTTSTFPHLPVLGRDMQIIIPAKVNQDLCESLGGQFARTSAGKGRGGSCFSIVTSFNHLTNSFSVSFLFCCYFLEILSSFICCFSASLCWSSVKNWL